MRGVLWVNAGPDSRYVPKTFLPLLRLHMATIQLLSRNNMEGVFIDRSGVARAVENNTSRMHCYCEVAECTVTIK